MELSKILENKFKEDLKAMEDGLLINKGLRTDAEMRLVMNQVISAKSKEERLEILKKWNQWPLDQTYMG